MEFQGNSSSVNNKNKNNNNKNNSDLYIQPTEFHGIVGSTKFAEFSPRSSFPWMWYLIWFLLPIAWSNSNGYFGQENCLGSKRLSPGIPRDRIHKIPGDFLMGSQESGDSQDPRRFSQGIPSHRISNIIQYLLDGIPIFVGCQGVRILTGSFLM